MHFVGGWHVLHVAAVDEGDLLGPLAHARSSAVHRGVAATNHDDAASLVVWVCEAERSGVQIVETVDDAVGVFAWNAEVVGVVAADRNDDAVVALRLQVGDGEVATEHLAALEAAAESRDRLVLTVEHLNLWQSVLRNAVAQHAAWLWIFLEDGDVVSGNEQVVRGRCAGWARADYRNALPCLWLQFEWHRWIEIFIPHCLQHLVAGVAVAVANRDRLVYLVATAVILAWRRADATEDAWEWNGAFEDARRLAELRLSVRLQESRNVDVARALVLAWRQAVGVVVAEDQLKVGAADLANAIGLRRYDLRWLRLC